jgi:hypothetical protein
MGREIRKVPATWKHPKSEREHYDLGEWNFRPLHGENFDEELKEYRHNRSLWRKKQHPDQLSGIATNSTFVDWHGNEPEPEDYRHYKDEDCTHYQMYETVSEGTPCTPAFATLQELEDYLVDVGELPGTKYNQKYSRAAAHAFCSEGWAPSFVVSPAHGIENGIESLKH